jgi:hypothetical protein
MALLAVAVRVPTLPNGFTNAQLRLHVAGRLSLAADAIITGQMTCDVGRPRPHQAHRTKSRSQRNQVTDNGWRSAPRPDWVHTGVLRPSLATPHEPDPLPPSIRRPRDRSRKALEEIPAKHKLID